MTSQPKPSLVGGTTTLDVVDLTSLSKAWVDKAPAHVGNPQTLPEVYQVKSKIILDDNSVVKKFKNNFYVQICTRLAVLRVSRKFTAFDPKGILTGRTRLYSMIGYRLKKHTFNRMCLLSKGQWTSLEQAWSALMHTVLLNTDFNPLLQDRQLRIAISKFKIWFLEFSLRGKIKRSNGRQYVVLHNWEKTLKSFKTLSSWMQYFALDDVKNNIKPPSLPWFPGWNSSRNLPTFVWFDGHLAHWRDVSLRPLSDRDIRTLCQIRTFGRALPPPTTQMCKDDLKKQCEVLTTENVVKPEVLSAVSQVAYLIGKRLKVEEISKKSHISVSTSGCFELSQRDGGIARYVQNYIKELECSVQDVRILHDGEEYDLFDHYTENSVDVYNDAYGVRIFPRRNILFLDNPTMLDCLYRKSGHARLEQVGLSHTGKLLLPSEVCPAILLMATSEAILQGYYHTSDGVVSEPSTWLLLPSGRRLPMWNHRYPLRYKSVDFPITEMQCLAEPGAKSRSLGKSQTWFTLTMKIMRFMIEPILARDGRARIGLRSTNKMWSFLKFIQKVYGGNPIFQSTDYSAATDWISLKLLSAIWEPIFGLIDKNHPFLIYKDLVTCPRRLHFGKKFLECEPLDKTHRCGSFMGEPMSFMSLTLINLIIEEISSFFWKTKVPLYSMPITNLVSNDPLAICGDDVASLREDVEHIKMFKSVVSDVGMKLSYKDGISSRVLVFCEDHVLRDEKGKILYIDVIKSRLLTTMCRQHSENRSSILGKGRMLTNQLDYFDDKVIKIFIMEIYHQIFDRSYNYMMQNMNLPYYLPPSCGGMGYPIEDSLLPSNSYMYIGYIYRILDNPNIMEKYFELLELSSLNKRNKHGIDNTENVLKTFNRLTSSEFPLVFHEGEILEFKNRTIYKDVDIGNTISKFGIEVPPDPYTGGFDRDSLRNEAQRYGLIPLTDYLEQIERTLNFQEFLKDDTILRSQRTFEQWVQRSSRYWKRCLYGLNTRKKLELAAYGRQKFKNLNTLDRAVQRSFDGYIYPDTWVSLADAGPSLRIDFAVLRTRPQRKFLKFRDTVPVSEPFSPIE